MTTFTPTSLRARLRADTRLAHERLDEEVSKFNLTTPDGFSSFLNMQFCALQTLSVLDRSAKADVVISDLVERAALDLGKLGSSPRKSSATIEPVHPLAIEYAVAGSRLGSQLLKKRWEAASHPKVRRANAYFSAPSHIDMWASFCDTTEAMQATGPLADRIVRDADRIFHIYRECARAPLLTKGAIDA